VSDLILGTIIRIRPPKNLHHQLVCELNGHSMSFNSH